MNGTDTLQVCGTDACLVPPAEYVRLRYFFGQRLGVIDLADEQSYLVGKQRFHNLRLHGVGVLCGLRAERYVFPQGSPPASRTTLLRVHRGAALDGCGREIVVGWDQCIDVAAWLAQHPKAAPGADAEGLRLWVALRYRECPSDPAPAPRDPCGCDTAGCEFARIREGFELKLLTDADAAECLPGGSTPGHAFPIAQEVLVGTLDDAYRQLASLLAGEDCGEPANDPCILLANFQVDLDEAATKVVDISTPDNTIPQRRSLLSAEALQRGLLRALAAAGDAELIGQGPHLGAAAFVDAGKDFGTLSIGILEAESALSRDPFATPAQLKAKVFQFTDDGKWVKAPTFKAAYAPGPPPRIELQWGTGLGEGRYRALIESDRAQPPVDQRMRPLTPRSWARHFRLVTDAEKLSLVGSLYE